jgi:hypothetical protein
MLPSTNEMLEHNLVLIGSDIILYDKPTVQMIDPAGAIHDLLIIGAGINPPDSSTYPGMEYLVVSIDPAYSWLNGTYTVSVENQQGMAVFTFDSVVVCPQCKPAKSRRGR